jgi:hypothetical protein
VPQAAYVTNLHLAESGLPHRFGHLLGQRRAATTQSVSQRATAGPRSAPGALITGNVTQPPLRSAQNTVLKPLGKAS